MKNIAFFLIWELIFIYLLRTFPPHLGSFLCCFFFHYVSAKFPLAFFRWFYRAPKAQRIEAVSLFGSRWALSEDSGFKSYPSRPEVYLVTKTWCDRQQLWKAVITGNTVTRLSIPIRGRGKITWRRPEGIWPKRSERRNNTKNYQDEGEKSAINK